MDKIEELKRAKKEQEKFLQIYILLKFIPKKEYSKMEYHKIFKRLKQTFREIDDIKRAIQILLFGESSTKRKLKKNVKDILNPPGMEKLK